MGKIAILTDSGCGLEPTEITNSTYVVPLHINFKEKSYRDNIDITAAEVYDRMLKGDIPKTSIAPMGDIESMIKKIKEDGYDQIISISISSGLSGIYNAMNLALGQAEGIKYKSFDTKNISIGAGFFVIYAQTLLDKFDSVDDLYDELQSKLYNSKLFFNIDTLKFLIEGGRIGKVLGGIGSMLKITPVMSCDKDGVYYTVSKKRSPEKAIEDMITQVKAFLAEHEAYNNRYYFTLVYRNDENVLQRFTTSLADEFANATKLIQYKTVSPALGVHTGPGLIGLGAFCL